ncbi:MAG TPA: ABC transporter ATP-binding protein [Pirellulales bacterium]|jgi:ABC-2 type transport system ATP-binding protein|nr:ABC transporter ATP-binding protein [Pirellulales bacterium]
MPLVDLRQVTHSYGHVRALNGVTLQLEPGTIGLIGNNGAGKSTLLKILLGLIRPDSGEGSLLGFPVGRAGRQLRGQLGYMPESNASVPMLRGVEYVTLSGELYGMPHRDAQRRAHEVLGYVSLGELRYRRLEEYSTGNLQRLKLAAALVHDPQLLLLDEPTNGLDPAGRQAMLGLLEDLIAETRKSVILCTHLLGDVERLCNRIVVLDRGTVVRSGTMESLRSDVRNRYELGWEGASEAFLGALRSAGVDVWPSTNGKATLGLPDGWPTSELFRLALREGALINHLKVDEENLERLFLRITRQAEAQH